MCATDQLRTPPNRRPRENWRRWRQLSFKSKSWVPILAPTFERPSFGTIPRDLLESSPSFPPTLLPRQASPSACGWRKRSLRIRFALLDLPNLNGSRHSSRDVPVVLAHWPCASSRHGTNFTRRPSYHILEQAGPEDMAWHWSPHATGSIGPMLVVANNATGSGLTTVSLEKRRSWARSQPSKPRPLRLEASEAIRHRACGADPGAPEREAISGRVLG